MRKFFCDFCKKTLDCGKKLWYSEYYLVGGLFFVPIFYLSEHRPRRPLA